jgi:RNA polymerase sigma-70 factor (ECF subfamily)
MKISWTAPRFEPHRVRLLGLARGWLGNHADAQDAVQDAWLRVQSGVPPTLESDAAWLVSVLRHLCIDRLRRRRIEAREASAEADDAGVRQPHEPSAEQVATRLLESQAALRRMAGLLAPDDLAAVLLHAVFDYEHRDIARWAGQSEAATRQRVHRALRRTRARLVSRHSVDDEDAHQHHDDAHAAESREAVFSLCWRAVQARDAAGLIARVRPSAAPAPVPSGARSLSTGPGMSMHGSTSLGDRTGHRSIVPALAAAPTIAVAAAAAGGAHRSSSQVLQVDGVLALAWILDGVVLCTVRVGPLSTSREDCDAAACAP